MLAVPETTIQVLLDLAIVRIIIRMNIPPRPHQPGLRTSQPGLRASYQGFRASQLGLLARQLVGRSVGVFVPDGINPVGDYNSRWVGVCLDVWRPSFTMEFLNTLINQVEIWYGGLL